MPALSFLLVVFPMVAALGCFFVRCSTIRSAIVIGSGGLLIGSAILLIPIIPFRFSPESFFGVNPHEILKAADFLLLFIILYFGVKHKSWLISGLAIFQIVLLGYLEFF